MQSREYCMRVEMNTEVQYDPRAFQRCIHRPMIFHAEKSSAPLSGIVWPGRLFAARQGTGSVSMLQKIDAV